MVAYTLQQCVDACTLMNFATDNKTCRAIVLSLDLSNNYVNSHKGNCWLKSSVGKELVTDALGTVAVLNL